MSIFSLKHAAPAAEMLRDAIDEMSRDGSLLSIADRWFVFSGSDIRTAARLARRTGQVQLLVVACIGMAVAIGLLVILVRRLKAARLAAERSQKLQAEFLANVSHEIRTPMNGVVGNAELLLDMRIDAAYRPYVETIHDSARNQLELINQILDQSKIDSGVLLLETAAFCPVSLIGNVVRTFHNAAQSKGLWLRVHGDETDSPALIGDALRIRQIASNLINNALKFTAAGGVDVHIDCRRRGTIASLEISVADTGIGIELSQQNTVFERFRQADASTTRCYGGTGLGLSISRQLAMLMGGTLNLTSQPGTGSVFRLRLELPVSSATTACLAAGQHGALSSGTALANLRVLLVEDNTVNQTVAKEMLKRLGALVEIAGDGRQAVERCRHFHYDVILMDCHMPIMDGFAATAAIRSLDSAVRNVPIIALTAGVSGEEQRRALNAGMTAFLSKPISRGEMASALAVFVPRGI